MGLTKNQKAMIQKHMGGMVFIGILIFVLWTLVAVAKSQGF